MQFVISGNYKSNTAKDVKIVLNSVSEVGSIRVSYVYFMESANIAFTPTEVLSFLLVVKRLN